MYPPVEWGGLFQRPQHLAREFSKRLESVIYIQPAGLRNPRLLDLRRIKGFYSSDFYHLPNKAVNKGLVIKRLPFIPFHGLIFVEAINAAIFDSFVKRLDKDHRQAPCLLWVAAPAPFFAKSKVVQAEFPLVFDWLDDYAIFTHLSKKVVEMQYELAVKADLVFASSRALVERAKQHRPENVFFLPNGVDLNHWRCKYRGRLRGKIAGSGKIVGYFGTLSHWIDRKLVMDMARRHPNWAFVFIGPRADNGELTQIFELPNCLHIPRVDYKELPEFACDFDVCWMPFKINALTISINPVKVYEYLAMGKPVVVPEFPDLEDINDVLLMAGSSINEWDSALERAFEHGQNPKLLKQRQDKVKEYSWESIADRAINVIDEAGVICKRRG